MGARLARAVRVTPKAASKWIHGEARPSHDKKIALARWLGVREAWLDYGQGRMLRDDAEAEANYARPPREALEVAEPSPARPLANAEHTLSLIEEAVLAGELEESDLLLLEQLVQRLRRTSHHPAGQHDDADA
ncbi:helix-turn-helix domain-containing protein [Salinicola endophyticus]|uniref:helix-turn-helix domain-containing protein n=1 Tax=Salinicola endophyticus TaxID=1949083 RepID=UPI001300B0A7|nr:helix-turn-helix transcriptional regulator [Salinicola endophyticus]